ncbi:hypothetical protein AAMO2058_000407400 [Amorphochlora amoebiformis]|uniref:Transaldolase n=1 Tax=Amorphochlora amoebiformis TaxID=1561963 RepID=A0A7S0GV54_9EUKA|mmetsp:Transcript_18871/g.30018  ORF Transcript_18871/g.30018 Transcript_18871/m.30018 type:complete len:264 (+) Transcript_18871:66-857(+)
MRRAFQRVSRVISSGFRSRRYGTINSEKTELKDRKDIRLYLETADQVDWRSLLSLGIFNGINTNPFLIQEAGIAFSAPVYPELRSLIRTAVDDYNVNEIFIQAWGTSKEDLVTSGLHTRMFDRHVVVALPFTFEGTQAAAELIDKGANVCMTAGHAQKQALMGSALSADYFAPNISSIFASGEDAIAECIAMQEVIDGLESNTRVMATGLRNADDLVQLSKAGIKTFSVTPSVAYELINQPMTCKMTDEFERITQTLMHAHEQ